MYSCHECNAPFTGEDNLTRHKKYHCIQPFKDSKNTPSKRQPVERNQMKPDGESTLTSSDDEIPTTFDGILW